MYSKWHKIDLHIHTDKSKETKSGDYNGNFSVQNLATKLKENEVEMISFTDHNIINSQAYENLWSTGIAALIGVELDVVLDESQLKNYIEAIFSAGNEDRIPNKPFHIIVIFKSSDYSALSTKLEKMYEKISSSILDSKIDLLQKKMLRTTTFKRLVEAFHDEDFFIIAHGNKPKGIIGPYKEVEKIETAQYEILMGSISALEMKSNIRFEHVVNMFNQGFRKLIETDFQKEDTTSYVVFSDNHDCEAYSLGEFQTWIKGDLSFETIRIAFSDPASRIHTSNRKPTNSPNFLERLEIKTKNGEKQEIHFSPFLNVIIGGRSSGKSMLFNTILGLISSLSDDDKGLFKKIYSEMIDLKDTTIKNNLSGLTSTTSIACEAYFQEKIIELFRDSNSLKMKLKPFFLEFNEQEIQNSEKTIEDSFAELHSSYRSYFEAFEGISKGDISDTVKNSVKLSKKMFDIDSMVLAENPFGPDIALSMKDIINLIKHSQEISERQIQSKPLFNNQEIALINQFIDLLKEKETLLKTKAQRIAFQNSFLKKIQDMINQYKREELDQEVQQIEFSKDKLKTDLDDYRTYFASVLSLRLACHNLGKINVKVEDKKKTIGKYTFASRLNFELNPEIILTEFFEANIIEFNKSLGIFQNLIEMGQSQSNLRIKRFTTDGKKPQTLKLRIDEFVQSRKSKKDYEIIENAPTPVYSGATSQGKQASMFLDIKFQDFLANNNIRVLLIDQIEDNIDNKFIGEELVKLLRKIKTQTQIILVTHNPSIAIFGDAENIIVADNSNGKFSFYQGGLENEKIRKDACQILDGGDIAFKNRMDKYNISRLKHMEDIN